MFRFIFAFILMLPAFAQRPGTNYDEAKVPRYTLPDPLILRNGQPVRDARTWTQKRRPEIFDLFEKQMFGQVPQRSPKIAFELEDIDESALGGKAIRKQVSIRIAGKPVHLLLYLPAGVRGPVPVFLGLNFTGNHTIDADPGIRLAEVWLFDKETRSLVKRVAPDTQRGSASSRWPVEMILSRGYGVATIYYGDIEPDFKDGLVHSVRRLLLKPGEGEPGPSEWGAIGAWAWGLSRALDYLETDKAVDAKKVAVIGHSRLGKTALWAGAADTRFALVVSNDSGEGGAAISRRRFGETVENLNTSFPHWFCTNYKQYSGREDELPFDAHMLLALIAPRPLYVASAAEDLWADPRGEFLAAVAAGPVYELLGRKGLGTDKMPGLHQPTGDTVRYHIRAGKHDITDYDWAQFLDFADRHLKR